MNRVELLGHYVTPLAKASFLAELAAAFAEKKRQIIANHNLHSFYLYRRESGMRRFYDELPLRLIAVDGMPIVMWARLLGLPIGRADRCAFLDWEEAYFAAAAEKGWRTYYLGGAPGVAEKAAEVLRQRHPGLQIGVDHGYHAKTGEANEAVLARLQTFAPDFLIVGMGMPLQEKWIVDNFDRLPACAITHQGAAFDYLAGVQKRPPRLVGQLGLEWLYRFFCDPKRLFTRYFIEPWFLLPAMWADIRRYRFK